MYKAYYNLWFTVSYIRPECLVRGYLLGRAFKLLINEWVYFRLTHFALEHRLFLKSVK